MRSTWLAACLVACGCSGLAMDPPVDSGSGGGGGGDAGSAGGGSGGGATGGGAGGGGDVDAGTGDGGTGTIPVFVAIGHVARTIVSCDDGLSWVGNRSDDEELRCFLGMRPDGGGTDCDHKFGAGRGVAFTGTAFVANFGWGDPGTIRRSVDGVSWATVNSGANFGSMVAGANGLLMATARQSKVSADDGLTWTNTARADLRTPDGGPVYNVRRGGFGGSDGGVFVLVGDGPSTAASPDGVAWNFPATFPLTCGQSIQWEGGVAGNASELVMLGGDRVACRSTDNGATWTPAATGATDVTSRLLWTGSEFLFWGKDASGPSVFRSSDGVTWTATPTTVTRDGGSPVAGPTIGAVARSPQGTFVAVNAGWQQWYELQRFYRSTDGVAWTELPATAFTGSHPLMFIAFGQAQRSAVCP